MPEIPCVSRTAPAAVLRWMVACGSLLFVSLFAGASLAQSPPTGPGTIRGHLFTAESVDSVAAGAEVTLVFRDPGGTLHRVGSVAGSDGAYAFENLPTQPEQSYVIRVHYFDRDFLGAPMSFTPGESLLEFDFLVSREAQAIPPGGMPEGHPTGNMDLPPRADPPRQDPLAAIAIVGTVFGLFGLGYLRSQYSGAAPAKKRGSPEIDALIRDIASLDLRHSRREIEEADYRSVRASLFRKLEERTRAARSTAPPSTSPRANSTEAPLPSP